MANINLKESGVWGAFGVISNRMGKVEDANEATRIAEVQMLGILKDVGWYMSCVFLVLSRKRKEDHEHLSIARQISKGYRSFQINIYKHSGFNGIL